MGSIDPVPGLNLNREEKPKPIPVPDRKITLSGALGVVVGLISFSVGAFQGWELVPMGIGCAFMAAGYATRAAPPQKLCPACRFEIPLEASVCGHCQKEQLA